MLESASSSTLSHFHTCLPHHMRLLFLRLTAFLIIASPIPHRRRHAEMTLHMPHTWHMPFSLSPTCLKPHFSEAGVRDFSLLLLSSHFLIFSPPSMPSLISHIGMPSRCHWVRLTCYTHFFSSPPQATCHLTWLVFLLSSLLSLLS